MTTLAAADAARKGVGGPRTAPESRRIGPIWQTHRWTPANDSCQEGGAAPQNGAMEWSVAVQLKAVDPAELGRRVRAARVSRGLTQTALGHPEASAAYVSRIESGQRRPGAELLHTFATRLGVPVERLLESTVTLDPDEVGLQLNYAELALESGEVEEAERGARRVLEGLPEGPEGIAGTLRDR